MSSGRVLWSSKTSAWTWSRSSDSTTLLLSSSSAHTKAPTWGRPAAPPRHRHTPPPPRALRASPPRRVLHVWCPGHAAARVAPKVAPGGERAAGGRAGVRKGVGAGVLKGLTGCWIVLKQRCRRMATRECAEGLSTWHAERDTHARTHTRGSTEHPHTRTRGYAGSPAKKTARAWWHGQGDGLERDRTGGNGAGADLGGRKEEDEDRLEERRGDLRGAKTGGG